MDSKAREAADEIDACLARVLSAPEYLKAPGISELATIISRHFPPAEATQVAVEARDLEWALRELADGWIDNNQREGPYGFYQNARRVLELIASDARADAIRDAVERLRAARITGFNGVGSETMKEACVAALESLTTKEGDDGPTEV
jgi:hypothetical protein